MLKSIGGIEVGQKNTVKSTAKNDFIFLRFLLEKHAINPNSSN